MVVDLAINAQALCIDHLKQSDYFSSKEVLAFFIFTMLIPIIATVILVIFIRSKHQRIYDELTKSSTGYHTLAGVTLTSVYMLVYMLIMDMLAVHWYNYDKHELKGTVRNYVNVFTPAITLSLNLLMTGHLLLFVVYLCCVRLLKDNKTYWSCLNIKFFWPIMVCLCFVLGWSGVKDMQIEEVPEEMEKKRNLWVLMGIMFAPLFSFASHIGYIFMA